MKILRLMTPAVVLTSLISGCGGGGDASPPAVSLTSQTITFASPGAQNSGTTKALTATATSNLPVSFTSSTTAVCTVSGTTLTLVAPGSCTINADQAGNATYAAAPQVSRTITVSAPQAITFASGYVGEDEVALNFSRQGRTTEGGAFNWYQDTANNDWNAVWWAGPNPDVTDTNAYFGVGLFPDTVPYIGLYVLAPADGSVTLNGQSKLRVAVWGNDELTNRGVPTFTVFVQLKQAYSGCYVEVQHPVAITPTGIGAQTYDLPLANFTLKNNCDGSGVSTAAEALAQPIGAVHVQVLKANMQFSAGEGGGRYPNGINIGAISFQP